MHVQFINARYNPLYTYLRSSSIYPNSVTLASRKLHLHLHHCNQNSFKGKEKKREDDIMKLHSFLLPALAGIATASVDDQLQNAEAYIIRNTKNTPTNPPSIPIELARAILLQRLSTPEQSSALGQLPESIPQDESISYINQFGKAPRPLFEQLDDASEPAQLVVAFSGVTAKAYKDLKAAVSKVSLAFTAPGLSRMPVSGKKAKGCAYEQSIDPKNDKCWKGKTQYLEFDASRVCSICIDLL